jgi:hypothetical protein
LEGRVVPGQERKGIGKPGQQVDPRLVGDGGVGGMPVISVNPVGDMEGVAGENAEKLKSLAGDLRESGNVKTTDKQNNDATHILGDVMKSLSGDPLLDPTKVTKDALEAKFLDPKAVDEILQLKAIFDQVATGKPVDID